MRMRIVGTIPLAILALSTTAAASRRFAINKLGDALAPPGTTFSADNDPDFVRDRRALQSQLWRACSRKARGIAAAPRHGDGFTQYAYASSSRRPMKARSRPRPRHPLRLRARRCTFVRATTACAASKTRYPGSAENCMPTHGRPSPAWARPRHRSLIGLPPPWAAPSLLQNRPEIIADQPIVEALIDRALDLDEKFDGGAIHPFDRV